MSNSTATGSRITKLDLLTTKSFKNAVEDLNDLGFSGLENLISSKYHTLVSVNIIFVGKEKTEPTNYLLYVASNINRLDKNNVTETKLQNNAMAYYNFNKSMGKLRVNDEDTRELYEVNAMSNLANQFHKYQDTKLLDNCCQNLLNETSDEDKIKMPQEVVSIFLQIKLKPIYEGNLLKEYKINSFLIQSNQQEVQGSEKTSSNKANCHTDISWKMLNKTIPVQNPSETPSFVIEDILERVFIKAYNQCALARAYGQFSKSYEYDMSLLLDLWNIKRCFEKSISSKKTEKRIKVFTENGQVDNLESLKNKPASIIFNRYSSSILPAFLKSSKNKNVPKSPRLIMVIPKVDEFTLLFLNKPKKSGQEKDDAKQSKNATNTTTASPENITTNPSTISDSSQHLG